MYLQRWHGWCHMKLLLSRHKFCTTMHHVTSHKATKYEWKEFNRGYHYVKSERFHLRGDTGCRIDQIVFWGENEIGADFDTLTSLVTAQ